MALLAPLRRIVPAYAALAPALLLLQPLALVLIHVAMRQRYKPDLLFWLLPLRAYASIPNLPPWAAALGCLASLAVTWALAVLSFRRAAYARRGFWLAALSIVPVVQILAVALLAMMPVTASEPPSVAYSGERAWALVHGVLAGIAIAVLAVLISAVFLGAYGWGLFLLTPFLVGLTTSYLAHRTTLLSAGQNVGLVMLAAGLAGAAIIMFALEGLVCLVLAAPLGAAMALAGGGIGRYLAQTGHRRGRPLLSLALLPAVFAMDAALPPAIPLETHYSIEIDAPTAPVWRAVIGAEPIGPPPAWLATSGIAYPVRSQIEGSGVGASRVGVFSTGLAQERVTAWEPERTLAVEVLTQPPAMTEMSPYHHVHAPHVLDYFQTTTMRFDLEALPNQRTRLTLHAHHILRLDPVLYWQPMVLWAIEANVNRVLHTIASQAERD